MHDDKAPNSNDPGSRILPGLGGRDFQQSCKFRAVVGREHAAILADRATSVHSDKQQAPTMIAERNANTGTTPREVSSDAGYCSSNAVDGLFMLGVDPFIVPERTHQDTKLELGRWSYLLV